jgi:beta-glucosidase/6-phospho-beta-glucosidase/beta-galactosidase
MEIQFQMNIYRFSISWARILPDNNTINAAGIQYYSNLIDELIANGIEPLVTIYHWDLPQYIQDLGGFMDPIIVDYYKKYVEVLFENYGSRVKRWITFNEPYIFCVHGYSEGSKAPLIKAPGVGEYLCGHYMLQAHAAAAKIYNEKYRATQKGQIGISLFSNFYFPRTKEDEKIAHQVQEFQLGWFANPIFSKTGGYPEIMVKEIAKKTVGTSRLPQMSDEMKDSLIGSADFLAINYYTSRLATPLVNTPPVTDWYSDNGAELLVDDSWKQGKSEWLYVVPEGLRELLKWIKRKYDNPTVMITENGYSDNGELNDDDRIDYLKGHLAAVSNAINEDQCKVIAYTAWSIIDNFEWMEGFSEKFGIYAVNLTSPTKERTAKKSVDFFKDLTKNRKFDY